MTNSSRNIETIFDTEAAERAFGFAQASRVGELLFISGTLAVDEQYAPVGEGDMPAQLRCVYRRLANTLQAQGAEFSNVIRETVYVTSMDALLAANSIRLETYGEHFPACTVVEVARLAFPPCMVEIELIARIPS
ncbi:MAG TPA: RidA family protein [Xanthomonadales bacterium]|nr:RidA family protein [Xanthomonadales bacterium]